MDLKIDPQIDLELVKRLRSHDVDTKIHDVRVTLVGSAMMTRWFEGHAVLLSAFAILMRTHAPEALEEALLTALGLDLEQIVKGTLVIRYYRDWRSGESVADLEWEAFSVDMPEEHLTHLAAARGAVAGA